MVAATLIAVMAFQSALNPPGGVWDDDKNSGGGMGLTYLVSMVIISPTKDDSEATSLRNK
ncbi:hypothetical protein CK203_075034 [Vitis vinifera]|uniref:PGG domain-containing protein n=1 Tax=Vitis vinifera TaxID=29760 RepID=A0A438E8L8_VITVI|nr:hypothetical protein CK203_075034 [Vitis vinifera]